ncbi:hypothetical protein [Oscillatoria acuminata]|jgi:hypothetical protein|uniref:Uncharacterized protein n=2 Tax=Oscillatoriaceae TaxID=1892254 RepID=A0A6H1U2G0_9CYAN|nr:hypothetical protein [Oscillatoria acuminata]AFY85532.1 hypothetical protein Oscil6304_6077 [Oscillatoria acuminata PCC 6304]QIZ73011.1 hypothetical protein HCG48_22385 [Oxynema aestuarii AP17]
MGKKLTLRTELIPLVESFASAKGDDSLGAAMNRLIYLGLKAEGFIPHATHTKGGNTSPNNDDLEILGVIDL